MASRKASGSDTVGNMAAVAPATKCVDGTVVIKAVEKGEQFNKYTAVLNVEELEGTPFPYGFESNEQTIKACLEFAFEGTGWHVGICTVTKKRTKKVLENYSTTEEIETKITASKEAVEAGVAYTLKNYYTSL